MFSAFADPAIYSFRRFFGEGTSWLRICYKTGPLGGVTATLEERVIYPGIVEQVPPDKCPGAVEDEKITL